MMEAWRQRLEDAIHIVTAAGDKARRAQTHLVVEHKLDNDYVTQVDQDTERTIRRAIMARYPQDGFWGEEYGASGNADRLWVLDPIDGTTNYIRGMEEYAISLAYLVAASRRWAWYIAPGPAAFTPQFRAWAPARMENRSMSPPMQACATRSSAWPSPTGTLSLLPVSTGWLPG